MKNQSKGAKTIEFAADIIIEEESVLLFTESATNHMFGIDLADYPVV